MLATFSSGKSRAATSSTPICVPTSYRFLDIAGKDGDRVAIAFQCFHRACRVLPQIVFDRELCKQLPIAAEHRTGHTAGYDPSARPSL